ncbi:hypothetical protein CYY_010086 [Polysphondylium violaceum]|uniref:Uncharacterized protein n=1 Tax=Polysphondylium violaceum TaxID=133409 RepID=A0A8J4PK28_9MYCE|nr:hypothetical protein CYY_010086 [Polysphondylium violaceum]
MDHLPHQQNLELTNKLLLTQIIMECNHLSYLILNSAVNPQVLEALFQESKIDKNNISELVDITFQFINQNQQLTQEKDLKVALNIFLKFMCGEAISKERCKLILMFIFLSLGKIGHFFDKDIQFFKQLSTKRISIINELLSHLPGQVLSFSQLQNMLTINLMASDNDYSNWIDSIVHLNDKIKGLGRSSIFSLFTIGPIDPTPIHLTTNLANENTNDNHIPNILGILIGFILTIGNDQTKIAINYTKQLINENFNGHDIFKIISTILNQITKYKLKNDQIQNIINYTKQLIDEKMNGDHISKIISTLSKQITQLNNNQIQSIINHTKQLNMNDHISKMISTGKFTFNYPKQIFHENIHAPVISTLSEQITKYGLNNDQVQNIINFTKQFINENMDGYDMSEIISTLSELITKYQFNNDQIQTIINYTKQLMNENIDAYGISKIISTLSELITKYQFNNDQIQTIINHTKQLINEKMNDDHISSIITLSKQITKYQFNNDQIQTIINYTKQSINQSGFFISEILSALLNISKSQLNYENPTCSILLDHAQNGIHLYNYMFNEYDTYENDTSEYDTDENDTYEYDTDEYDTYEYDDTIWYTPSTISEQITKYQLNDQIQLI